MGPRTALGWPPALSSRCAKRWHGRPWYRTGTRRLAPERGLAPHQAPNSDARPRAALACNSARRGVVRPRCGAQSCCTGGLRAFGGHAPCSRMSSWRRSASVTGCSSAASSARLTWPEQIRRVKSAPYTSIRSRSPGAGSTAKSRRLRTAHTNVRVELSGHSRRQASGRTARTSSRLGPAFPCATAWPLAGRAASQYYPQRRAQQTS